MKKALSLLMLFCLLLPSTATAELEAYFLNVGQGDAAIIICDGEAMVIDGGPSSASQLMYSYIKNTLGLESIKLMVATHPHADHIGGLSAVLNAVPVDVILSPVLQYDTKTFESFLRYANAQGTPIIIPQDGDSFQLGSADITILVCWLEAWTTNDMSIILRIDYKNTSFLFTGDAEYMAEYMVIDEWPTDLSADVLKVGHHGSKTSSSKEFLQAVSPQYAVISCGKNNSYDHPHQETLDALQEVNAIIYRTDQNGTIIMRSDGEVITIEPEKIKNRE